jgi:hypothetical protein
LSLVSEGTEETFGVCVIQHTAWWRTRSWSFVSNAIAEEVVFHVCVL